MSSDKCECGFYNRDRHHTKTGGGKCDFIACRKRIAEREQQLEAQVKANHILTDMEWDGENMRLGD